MLRVPAERYDAVVAELRGIAKEVRSISMQPRDATTEVADVEATIRNLRAIRLYGQRQRRRGR